MKRQIDEVAETTNESPTANKRLRGQKANKDKGVKSVA